MDFESFDDLKVQNLNVELLTFVQNKIKDILNPAISDYARDGSRSFLFEYEDYDTISLLESIPGPKCVAVNGELVSSFEALTSLEEAKIIQAAAMCRGYRASIESDDSVMIDWAYPVSVPLKFPDSELISAYDALAMTHTDISFMEEEGPVNEELVNTFKKLLRNAEGLGLKSLEISGELASCVLSASYFTSLDRPNTIFNFLQELEKVDYFEEEGWRVCKSQDGILRVEF